MQEQPSKAQRGQGRVAFLALLGDFRKLLQEGHPLVSIHSNHQQQLGIGYPQFTKYVKRYLEPKNTVEHQNKSTMVSAEDKPRAINFEAGKKDPATKKKTIDKPLMFSHNPNSGNSRNDLV